MRLPAGRRSRDASEGATSAPQLRHRAGSHISAGSGSSGSGCVPPEASKASSSDGGGVGFGSVGFGSVGVGSVGFSSARSEMSSRMRASASPYDDGIDIERAVVLSRDACGEAAAEPYPRDSRGGANGGESGSTRAGSTRGDSAATPSGSGAPPPPHVECDKLFVCERCLKYVRKRSTLARHEAKCEARHPPGKMIYEHKRSRRTEAGPGSRELVGADLAFWEIDGAKMKVYCQNLCLLAKLFLDHKTLYFDVEPFLFYVLTERDPETDTHVAVGYFSKEKASLEEYNLACILTLPPYQRRGYGSLLISMSYELSRREGKVGTPERPLSDLGLVSYRSYWCRVVLAELRRHKASLSLKDLSAATGFREADVASALTSLNLLKYWKGQHIVSATPKIVDDHLRSFGGPEALFAVNPEWVRWEPPAAAPAPANRKGGGDR